LVLGRSAKGLNENRCILIENNLSLAQLGVAAMSAGRVFRLYDTPDPGIGVQLRERLAACAARTSRQNTLLGLSSGLVAGTVLSVFTLPQPATALGEAFVGVLGALIGRNANVLDESYRETRERFLAFLATARGRVGKVPPLTQPSPLKPLKKGRGLFLLFPEVP
jgi:xanthosine utilization system XapX-like protein